MILNGEDILEEIDDTLDQLIQNANVLKQIGGHPEYRGEKAALEKTQESLLSHLIHMDCMLDKEKISTKKREQTAQNISRKLSNIGHFDRKFIQKIYANFLKPTSSADRKKLKFKKVKGPSVGKRRNGELILR